VTTFKIYCPQGVVTGGPEALHQLGAALIQAGFDARMYYFPPSPSNHCMEKYLHYAVPQTQQVDDRPDEVIVLPETATHFLWQFQKAQVLIWWLSVDNHPAYQRPSSLRKRCKLWWNLRFGKGFAYFFQKHERLTHAWQSEYARQALLRRGIRDTLPLTDYISPAIWAGGERSEGPREPVVLYNPKKGYKFTKRLISHCSSRLPRLRFVALAGFSESELQALMRRASMYIDFGEHPGRDRIPREAAACGCVVITGRKGSAANEIDVPLPPQYKIDQDRWGALGRVARMLEAVLQDPDTHRRQQEPMREAVRAQHRVFLEEAAALGRRFAGPPAKR